MITKHFPELVIAKFVAAMVLLSIVAIVLVTATYSVVTGNSVAVVATNTPIAYYHHYVTPGVFVTLQPVTVTPAP